jgi:heptosyltransferase-1
MAMLAGWTDPLNMSGPRILAVRLSSMGDVIHTLPAVASLKKSFPSSAISWIIQPRWAPLLEGNPYVDEVIPFERTSAGIRTAWRRLRARKFDLVIDFQGLVQSALLAAATRSHQIVGFHRGEAREALASIFYTTAVRTKGPHRVDSYLNLAAAAGATRLLREFPLPMGSPEGDLPRGNFVLASPLAGWGSKQWPLEYYSELARTHVETMGLPLVVNGPPDSAPTLRQIEHAHLHLSGLPGLIDATRRATAVIGVDSGPMHLAAALRKPGVALFGPTDPATHGPYGGSLKVLRAPSAITSYKRLDGVDPSMRAIRPSAVLEALLAQKLDLQNA